MCVPVLQYLIERAYLETFSSFQRTVKYSFRLESSGKCKGMGCGSTCLAAITVMVSGLGMPHVRVL